MIRKPQILNIEIIYSPLLWGGGGRLFPTYGILINHDSQTSNPKHKNNIYTVPCFGRGGRLFPTYRILINHDL